MPTPEEPTRDLADSYPDGVLGARADGVVTVLNDQAASLLRVPRESRGQQLADVLRLQDQDARTWLEVNDPFGSISIRRGIPEQSWLNDAGEEVLTTARILRDVPLGPVTGVAIGLRTGRGRARLDRERSDLVATVAHELRSPLTGVKGFVQALLNRWDKLSDDQRKLMLHTVHSDADRLARLIAELLDVARIDTGRLQLYPRDCDGRVLVQRVADSVAAGTARPIEVVLADDVPGIHADPDKFTQVLTNLVENAVRHGEGVVRVSLEALPPEQTWPGARIVVEDEGDGIPEELRRQVFTKFWTSGAGGSGLGMYIVHGLVRAHGGDIAIGESPSGGARITVHWPSAQNLHESSPSPPAPPS
ncbi:PAS domain-containing sensor histidine kinase [Nocardioides gansuensis]|uniref:histidine kinase n=1 Tax=Nocardioides gansuensis TaxID=2138300 RepID=A0A2T8FBB2_9ACTN|nr:HAMP domain-containing sensor histidine kinase [Nocardioides gansuensis]PVG83009.1 PAS domain-containing sensor histidine kinase [Nocardioides gansuensis]